MPREGSLSARLAALPLEARRIALAHLARLAEERKGDTDRGRACLRCQDRRHALVDAIRQGSALPEDPCPVCNRDWQALDGSIPSSSLGDAVLPSRRRLLRFGVAELVQRPVRDLPEDKDLARAFAICHLVHCQGASEALTMKALHRTLEGKPAHGRREWDQRMTILERRATRRQEHPAAPLYLRWWKGDLVDLVNSEVVVALPEVEMLHQRRPDLGRFASDLPETEHLLEGACE